MLALIPLLACVPKMLPVPDPVMGSPATRTDPPGESASPAAYGSLDCGLSVGYPSTDERIVSAMLLDSGEILVSAEVVKGSYEASMVLSLRDQGPSWSTLAGAGRDEDTPVTLSHYEQGYLLAGTTWSHGAGMSDLWMVYMDSQGKIEWQRTYGKYDRDVAIGLVQTEGGGLLVGTIPDYGLLVLQVDALGGVTSRVGYEGTWANLKLLPTAHGALIYGAVLDKGQEHAWAMEIDTQGQVIWKKRWSEQPSLSLALEHPEGLLLVGQDLHLVSESGATIWRHELSSDLQGLQVSGGGVTALGPAILTQSDAGSAVFQLDLEGAPVWTQSLVSIQASQLVQDKRGVVVLGQGKGAKSWDLYGVRLDSATGEGVCKPVPKVEELPTPSAGPALESAAEAPPATEEQGAPAAEE